MLQNKFEIFEIQPLKGNVIIPEEAKLTMKSWIASEYQDKQEQYINSMFGLRNLCVRLNNQIDFEFFNKANANDVIIGKDNYLYELNYIKAYTGADFLGEDSITHTLNRLKFISDTLNKLNKHLIVIYAPGKASFYPEFIPDEFLKDKTRTNYSLFTEGSKKMGLNVIDFNKWFVQNKNKSKYPLYPQHGIHWSVYGAALAADSLIKKIENLMNIDAPNLTFDSVITEKPKDSDYDIAAGMNLLFDLKSFNLAYPQLKPIDTVGKTKPKTLIITDSFYWVLYGLGVANCFDSNHRVWYYNKQSYPESFTQEVLVKNLNLKEEINKYDVIIISATDNNLRDISWGFIEEAEKMFKNSGYKSGNNAEYYDKVKNMIKYIKNDKQWLEDTEIRARQKNISIDSCLVLEAMWQIDNEKK